MCEIERGREKRRGDLAPKTKPTVGVRCCLIYSSFFSSLVVVSFLFLLMLLLFFFLSLSLFVVDDAMLLHSLVCVHMMLLLLRFSVKLLHHTYRNLDCQIYYNIYSIFLSIYICIKKNEKSIFI